MSKPAPEKRKIDLDRGVMHCVHTSSGMNIYMYLDTPGVYYNAYETVVPEALAREAGFDVDKFARARVKQERMRAAMAKIEAEIEAIPEDQRENIVFEKAGFKARDINGLGLFNVEDPDGNQLNTTPLSREMAEKLITQLAPKE